MYSISESALAGWKQDWSKRWLVTGAAGFVGSHLVEQLLKLRQSVVAYDNLATGYEHNLRDVRSSVGEEAWKHCTWTKGDMLDLAACEQACSGVDVVLHQAALGSVPRSVANPLATHAANATGFLHLLEAARKAGVKRVVYASSSSVYGDSPKLPKQEQDIGRVLSPYAASKLCMEIYATAFSRTYGLELIGLRYFNVFGPRQNPLGPYAAVIPKWMGDIRDGRPVVIFGDGNTSRDFSYVANIVQANLRAATVSRPDALGRVFNVACHAQTTLTQLSGLLRKLLAARLPGLVLKPVEYRDFRPGDVRHSLADISAICDLLGYQPSHTIEAGLAETADWFCQQTEAVAK